MDKISDTRISSTGSLVQDPVCGMDVDPATSENHLELDGHDYDFCSAGCLATFEADPTAYLGGATRPEQRPAGGHDGHDGLRPSGRRVCRRGRRGVDVSDAPGDPAAGPGHVPHLRDGARAGHGDRGQRARTPNWPT